jgi:hypothetical protein
VIGFAKCRLAVNDFRPRREAIRFVAGSQRSAPSHPRDANDSRTAFPLRAAKATAHPGVRSRRPSIQRGPTGSSRLRFRHLRRGAVEALPPVPHRRLAAPRSGAARLPGVLKELIVNVVGHWFSLTPVITQVPHTSKSKVGPPRRINAKRNPMTGKLATPLGPGGCEGIMHCRRWAARRRRLQLV